MQIMLETMKIKILTSVIIPRNVTIGTILKYYNDNNAVVTSYFIQVGS